MVDRIKVKIEDSEFSEAVKNGEYDIAVPIQVSVGKNGDKEILSYDFCKNVAEEFSIKHVNDPFSTEAVDFLKSKLETIMAEYGYYYPINNCRISCEYRCTDPAELEMRKKCEIISSTEGLKYHHDLSLDEVVMTPDYEADRLAVIKDDDVIIAYAGLNSIEDDEDMSLEIYVECAPEYREKGYGSACAAELSSYLISLGEKVKYVCYSDNTASKRTAEKAGFEYQRSVMSFVCFKNDR